MCCSTRPTTCNWPRCCARRCSMSAKTTCYAVAQPRAANQTLWRALRRLAPSLGRGAAYDQLTRWRSRLDFERPFEFLRRGALCRRRAQALPCAASAPRSTTCSPSSSTWRWSTSRPTQPSLQGFLAELRLARGHRSSANWPRRGAGVRVMTVHGAKGLEAPIVILADAASKPSAAGDRRAVYLRRRARPAASSMPRAADAMCRRPASSRTTPTADAAGGILAQALCRHDPGRGRALRHRRADQAGQGSTAAGTRRSNRALRAAERERRSMPKATRPALIYPRERVPPRAVTAARPPTPRRCRRAARACRRCAGARATMPLVVRPRASAPASRPIAGARQPGRAGASMPRRRGRRASRCTPCCSIWASVDAADRAGDRRARRSPPLLPDGAGAACPSRRQGHVHPRPPGTGAPLRPRQPGRGAVPRRWRSAMARPCRLTGRIDRLVVDHAGGCWWSTSSPMRDPGVEPGRRDRGTMHPAWILCVGCRSAFPGTERYKRQYSGHDWNR